MMPMDETRIENPGSVAKCVNERRLWDRHMAMAEIGATPKGGLDRQALTEEDNRARVLFAKWADELGLACEIDSIGNMFVRRPGTDPEAAPVLSGSHLDTQPLGGRFDGIYGVLAALEALQAIGEAATKIRRPIEAVVWTNEEGTRFQPSLMGSAAFANPAQLEGLVGAQDAAGITVEQALVDTRAALSDLRSRPLGRDAAAYVEAHIEQGPFLEAKNKTIGVVTGIQGWRRFVVGVQGEQGHAGTMPHKFRKDALVSACAIVSGLKELLHDPEDLVRLTVGRFNVSPNSPGAIPGHVEFTIDFRHPNDEVLTRRGDRIERACHEYAEPCTVTVKEISKESPVGFDGAVPATIRSVAERLDLSWMEIYSGATHDALNLAKVCPTGMIFVPCEGGISHNEAENAKPPDLAAGARVLAEALAELANS